MNKTDYEKYFRLISENRLDEATDFRREIMPKYIYKFYPLVSKTGKGKKDKQILDALKNKEIWCSKMEFFNDPYEGVGLYAEGIFKVTEKDLSKLFRIASFTANAASNISMWAYYANNHMGFCVKYEVIDNRYLYDVNYIEERKSLKVVWENAIRKHVKNQCTDKEQLFIYEKYLTKHISWQSENEYRIIYVTEKEDEKGRLIDCERIGLRPICIITGINCSEVAKKKLQDISLSWGCGGISQCHISDDKFILFEE